MTDRISAKQLRKDKIEINLKLNSLERKFQFRATL